MPTKITQKNLILFIYNELETFEMEFVKHEILNNPIVRDKYQKLVNTIKPLDLLWQMPNKTSEKIVEQQAHDGFGQTV